MNMWSDQFEGAVTICNRDGIVTYMNETSKKQFAKEGGADLIGKNLLNCHSEESRMKLIGMLESPSTNIYTIEKAGVKKIINQSPYYENGVFSGMIEISFVLPEPMAHHIRS